MSNMSNEDSNKIQKFNTRNIDDYNLCHLRCEIAVKGNGFSSELKSKHCDQDLKDKSSAMMVDALEDTGLRVCSAKIGELLRMLDLLDKRFASIHRATWISILLAMYLKHFSNQENIAEYIDEFECLSSKL